MSIRESGAQAFECLREASKMLSIRTICNGWIGNSRSENMNCRSVNLVLKLVWLKLRIHRQYFSGDGKCNGGKIVALPSRERNCLCIMLCDGNAKLCAIVAEISNHLIFGNDCRKLGGVVKEGQG